MNQEDITIKNSNGMNPQDLINQNSNRMPPLDLSQTKKSVADGRIPIKSLRTYQGDVEEAINKNKYTTSTILVAEQKRKEKEPEKIINPRRVAFRNNFFLTLGGLLLIVGVGAIGVTYYLKYTEKTPVIQKDKTILSFSSEKNISISSGKREDLFSGILLNKRSFNSNPNSILYLNITNGTVKANVSDVLDLLGPHMPPSLVRSFNSDYMFGIYSFDTNEPFIILKTNDFANSFSGMLKWEKDMVLDIGELFNIVMDNSTTGPVFIDQALRNRDLRILKGSDNTTSMLYSFIDKNTLLITKNENIFNAVIGKYFVSQQSR